MDMIERGRVGKGRVEGAGSGKWWMRRTVDGRKLGNLVWGNGIVDCL